MNTRRLRFYEWLVMLLAATFIASCDSQSNKRDLIEEYLDKAHVVWRFQGSALVASGSEIVLSAGYGDADIEAGRANTSDTKFPIGSITKSLTAIMIMQLEEEEKLKLDDLITKYLPQYNQPEWSEITIHHLLSHTSGIPDCLSFPEFNAMLDREVSPEEIISVVSDRSLEFSPGERYKYSSSGFILLGMIIEAVTGKSWESCIAEYICDRTGMDATGVVADHDSRSDFAIGYTDQGDQKLVRARIVHPSAGYSAGALSSSVEDLYLLDQALYSGDLLSRESMDKMFSQHTAEYGYGWISMNIGAHRMVGHAGGVPGYSTVFQRWLDDSLSVIVFSNNVNAPVFGMAVNLAAIMRDEEFDIPVTRTPVTLSQSQLAEYKGVYKVDAEKYRAISVRGDRLIARREEGNPTSLIAQAVDTFYFAHDQTGSLVFKRDSDGKVIESIFRRAFFTQTARKAGVAEADSILYGCRVAVLDDSILTKYVGRYNMEETRFLITVFMRDGVLFSQAADRPPVELIPLSDTEFALRGMAGRMIFEDVTGNGTIRLLFRQPGLEMSGTRID